MAMTLEQVKDHVGDVYYAPDSVYEYIQRKRADLPGAPFNHETRVPHGTVDQLTNVSTPPGWDDDWIASVNGQPLQLSRLFPSLASIKAALKAALVARADEAEAIAAQDNAYADSVDEIGTPAALVVSHAALDFGDTATELSFDITNSGDIALNWTITTSTPKVTVDIAAGDTLDDTDTITVSVDRSGMPPGTYDPTVEISSDAGNATITLNVVVP